MKIGDEVILLKPIQVRMLGLYHSDKVEYSEGSLAKVLDILSKTILIEFCCDKNKLHISSDCLVPVTELNKELYT